MNTGCLKLTACDASNAAHRHSTPYPPCVLPRGGCIPCTLPGLSEVLAGENVCYASVGFVLCMLWGRTQRTAHVVQPFRRLAVLETHTLRY